MVTSPPVLGLILALSVYGSFSYIAGYRLTHADAVFSVAVFWLWAISGIVVMIRDNVRSMRDLRRDTEQLIDFLETRHAETRHKLFRAIVLGGQLCRN